MANRLILGNAYHLSLKPGDDLIAAAGGLAKFMAWPGLVLTDSGGFQAFSLGALTRLSGDGFEFKSHLDGTLINLSPERAVEIQTNLNSDIAMCLDVCLPQPASFADSRQAVNLTTAWAKRSLAANSVGLNLFGIVQGAGDLELRRRSSQELIALDFPGYAIGGLSVGETKAELNQILQNLAPQLPAEKPRYAMGIGDPLNSAGCSSQRGGYV